MPDLTPLENGTTLTSVHLAWILNITREWHRDYMPASEVQQRMDAKFPAIEHRAIWERLIAAIK
jgi:hypothetical protein